MSDTILVLDAGSSRVKFTLFPAETEPTPARALCKGTSNGVGHHVRFVADTGPGRSRPEEAPKA